MKNFLLEMIGFILILRIGEIIAQEDSSAGKEPFFFGLIFHTEPRGEGVYVVTVDGRLVVRLPVRLY